MPLFVLFGEVIEKWLKKQGVWGSAPSQISGNSGSHEGKDGGLGVEGAFQIPSEEHLMWCLFSFEFYKFAHPRHLVLTCFFVCPSRPHPEFS